MNAFALSGLLTGIASSAIGIFVFIKQRRPLLSKIWVTLTITVAIWGFGCWRMASTTNKNEAFLWYRLAHIGVILIPVFIYHFVYVFLNLKKKTVLWGIYTIGSIFFIANLADILSSYLCPEKAYYLIIAHMKWIFGSFYMDTPPGPIYPYFVAFFCGTVTYIYYELSHAVKENKGLKRSQVKYFFFATIVGFIGGGSSFLPVFGINIYPFGNFATAIWPLIITYAIWQYRLMDIGVAITRAGIFGIVYTVVLGIPFWIGFKLLGKGLWILPVSIMAAFATSGPFIYLFLQRKAENRLLREQRRRQEVVIRASETFTLIKRISRLLRYIGLLVTTALKIDYSAIFLFDKRSSNYILSNLRGKVIRLIDPVISPDAPLIIYLQEHSRNLLLYEEMKELSSNSTHKNTVREVEAFMHNISAHLIVPSFIKDKLVGVMILGSKTSGEIYTHDDILTFKIMANSAALAIEYAQFLKEYDETQAKLREAEKLKGIAQMLHSLNHELRNIFNKMSIPVQMMELGEFDNNKDAFDNALKTVSVNVDLGVEILSYVQSYSTKSESNELKPNNPEEALNKAVTHFSQRFKDAGIILTKQIQPNLPTIQVKETFDDLFKNILANCYFALTDQPREQKLIDIQIKLSDDKTTIEIKVSDTGPDMTKITSYTAEKDSPFKERGKLGGVNLFLAYLITNDHKGKLTFESYEKGGTTFIVNIPITQKEL